MDFQCSPYGTENHISLFESSSYRVVDICHTTGRAVVARGRDLICIHEGLSMPHGKARFVVKKCDGTSLINFFFFCGSSSSTRRYILVGCCEVWIWFVCIYTGGVTSWQFPTMCRYELVAFGISRLMRGRFAQADDDVNLSQEVADTSGGLPPRVWGEY